MKRETEGGERGRKEEREIMRDRRREGGRKRWIWKKREREVRINA